MAGGKRFSFGPLVTRTRLGSISRCRSCGQRKLYRVEYARDPPRSLREVSRLILTDEELPTFNTLMKRLSEYSTLSSAPVAIINPNAEDGARLGDAYLLADFADITSWLAVLRH